MEKADDYIDLETIEAVERQWRRDHPIGWRVAELLLFLKGPIEWIRVKRRLRALGYDPR